jgi:uncharacterized protein (TIGR03067 family)
MIYLDIVAVLVVTLLCDGCGSGVSKPAATPENPAAAPEIDSGSETLVIPDFDRKPKAWDRELDVAEDACDESRDTHELAGRWEIISAEVAGIHSTTPGFYEFNGDQFRVVVGSATVDFTFEIDPHSQPKRLDYRQTEPEGTIVVRGIYRLDGNVLTISDARPFKPRPELFVDETTIENDYSLSTLRHVAKEE